MPEFELLCDELHLTAELEDVEQLQRLKHWWSTRVSRDIAFNGSPKEEYKFYLAEAKQYINVFLAHAFNDMSAIQYAALHGYDRYIADSKETAQTLNQLDSSGMSPLHQAAYKGYVHTTDALLNKGANPNIQNNHSQLPIHSVLMLPVRHNDQLLSHKKTIFKHLLKRSPESIQHQDDDGESVFHLMVGNEAFNDLLKQSLKTTPNVLSYPNHIKQYPIHTAILRNQINNARLLLESNLKLDKQLDREKRCALHYAAKYGTEEMVKLCIATSDDINVRDTYKKTPLILAAENGNQAAITVLLDNHANPDLVDYEGQTWQDRMTNRSPGTSSRA